MTSYNKKPARTLSKVQMQLQEEDKQRSKAINQQKHREYLARKEKRERRARQQLPPRHSAEPRSSDPSWVVERDRQRQQSAQSSRLSAPSLDNTFYPPSARRKPRGGGTISDLMPEIHDSLESWYEQSWLGKAPKLQAHTVRHKGTVAVSKGGFAALDYSDSEDESATAPKPTSRVKKASRESATAWADFRKKPAPVVKKPPIIPEPKKIEAPKVPSKPWAPVVLEHNKPPKAPSPAPSREGFGKMETNWADDSDDEEPLPFNSPVGRGPRRRRAQRLLVE